MSRKLLALLAVTVWSTGLGLALENTSLTSDKTQIDPESYRLSVEQQALIWAKDSFPRFIVWPTQAFDVLQKKSIASLRAAEEAIRLDSKNAFARALLARSSLLPADTLDSAREKWSVSFQNGGGGGVPPPCYDAVAKPRFLLPPPDKR